jgi:hypothetical protein
MAIVHCMKEDKRPSPCLKPTAINLLPILRPSHQSIFQSIRDCTRPPNVDMLLGGEYVRYPFLHSAAYIGNSEWVSELLADGADVRQRYNLRHREDKTTRVLLKGDVSVDAKNTLARRRCTLLQTEDGRELCWHY